GEGDALRLRLIKLFEELSKERKSYRERGGQIRKQIKAIKVRPQDEASPGTQYALSSTSAAVMMPRDKPMITLLEPSNRKMKDSVARHLGADHEDARSKMTIGGPAIAARPCKKPPTAPAPISSPVLGGLPMLTPSERNMEETTTITPRSILIGSGGTW